MARRNDGSARPAPRTRSRSAKSGSPAPPVARSPNTRSGRRRRSARASTAARSGRSRPSTRGCSRRRWTPPPRVIPETPYQPVLIDATYAGLLSGATDAPLVIPALNRDGDCLSDLVLPMFGSIAGAESVLLAFDADYDTTVAMAEAPHGTAPALQGKDLANPLAMILACGALLREAAATHGTDCERASRAIYEGALETVASGLKTPGPGRPRGHHRVHDRGARADRRQARGVELAGHLTVGADRPARSARPRPAATGGKVQSSRPDLTIVRPIRELACAVTSVPAPVEAASSIPADVSVTTSWRPLPALFPSPLAPPSSTSCRASSRAPSRCRLRHARCTASPPFARPPRRFGGPLGQPPAREISLQRAADAIARPV